MRILKRTLIDPQSPSGQTTTLVLAGNNPDIDSEKATTWSIGATIKPLAIPSLHLTATYFSTNFKDRIGQATTDLQTVLEQENLFAEIITRNPDSNLLNALCSDPGFRGDPLQCQPEFVKAIVDFRLRNIARSKVRGIDLMLDYIYSAERYQVTLGSAATYLIDYTTQISRGDVAHDFVNTVDNPNDIRMRSYISLSAGAFSGTVNVNYADSYVNNRSQLQRNVKSFTTVDIYTAVRLSKQLRLDKEGPLTISFSAVNVFDKDPPFVDNLIGYDGSNADPLGRLLALELRLKW